MRASVVIILCWLLVFSTRAVEAGRGLAQAALKSRCYHLDSKTSENLEKSQYKLCTTLEDFKRHPKSVTTFILIREEMSTEEGRGPASLVKKQIIAKRFYSRLGPNQYGRSRHPENPKVIFYPDENTVFLGFVGGATGKKYFYRVAF